MILTAKDIIANKTQLIKTNDEYVNVDIDDLGTCRFLVPTAADIDDVNTYMAAHSDANEQTTMKMQLVYQQMVEPDLHDPELVRVIADAVGKDPERATSGAWMLLALMKIGHIHNVAQLLSEKAGYYSGVKEAKEEIVLEGAEKVKNY